MKKFMALYMAQAEAFRRMMQDSTPEQQRKGMEAWMAWMNGHKNAIVDGGAPMGKTTRVDAKGASEIRNEIGGYTIVQANSRDDAAKLFTGDHPHLKVPGSWIEIVEIMPLPDM